MNEYEQSCVALVEDDCDMRAMLSDYLSFRGFRVHSFADPLEFLSQHKKEPASRIHLLISDIAMPRMNGLELVQHLHDSDPELPVVLISAGASHDVKQRAEALGVTELMDKPLSLEALFKVVLAALHARSSKEGSK